MSLESKASLLKIIPMGGVGEIGSNMTVFETNSQYLIVDYGILFPYEDFFDINYLIVNTSYLDSNKPITLFITHGHEDHIGAVAHFLTRYPHTKIYAPKFATSLIRKKFENRNLKSNITVYHESDILTFEEFEIHPVHVTHSIPDTYGLIIKDKLNKLAILFISDFKFDLNPLYEAPINYQKIKQLFNSAQKRLCFLDSTNILVNDKTTSESEVLPELETLLAKDKRSFVTLFSSNIFRLKSILEIAKRHGKYVVPVGRSVTSYLEAADEAGILDISKLPLKKLEEVESFNDTKLIAVLTGCQGDHLGALRRISSGEHRELKFTAKDQVIFSSKAIPGNSKKIARIYNAITQTGATIITDRDLKIHASGHPGKEDLKCLLEHIKPTDYFPIHGESYHLKKHYDFISDLYDFSVYLLKNFDQVSIDHNYELKPILTPNTDDLDNYAPVIIHGNFLEIERAKISERRKMACNGVIFVSINKKSKTFHLETKGLPSLIDHYEEAFLKLFKTYFFGELKNKGDLDTAESARVKIRKTYSNILGYKPITIVHVV